MNNTKHTHTHTKMKFCYPYFVVHIILYISLTFHILFTMIHVVNFEIIYYIIIR